MAKKLIKEGKSKVGRAVQILEHPEHGGYYHVKYHTGAAVSFNSYLPTNSADKPRSYWRERAEGDFKSYLKDENPNGNDKSLAKE